jgi:hypothetical protein
VTLVCKPFVNLAKLHCQVSVRAEAMTKHVTEQYQPFYSLTLPFVVGAVCILIEAGPLVVADRLSI